MSSFPRDLFLDLGNSRNFYGWTRIVSGLMGLEFPSPRLFLSASRKILFRFILQLFAISWEILEVKLAWWIVTRGTFDVTIVRRVKVKSKPAWNSSNSFRTFILSSKRHLTPIPSSQHFILTLLPLTLPPQLTFIAHCQFVPNQPFHPSPH